jgi:hypothetical protein
LSCRLAGGEQRSSDSGNVGDIHQAGAGLPHGRIECVLPLNRGGEERRNVLHEAVRTDDGVRYSRTLQHTFNLGVPFRERLFPFASAGRRIQDQMPDSCLTRDFDRVALEFH